MSAAAGPIVRLDVEAPAEVAGDLDGWLTAEIGELRRMSGVEDARIGMPEAAGDTAHREILLLLRDEETLHANFADLAGRLEAALPRAFAGNVSVRQAVLRSTLPGDSARPRCANCDSLLSGQYCGQCGQRAQDRFISLWELIRDAFGDLFELDSRLWRTLIPLALKPGRLTADYLEGRRARYMPPFRTYLVLSLIFFVVFFFDPREQFGILMEPAADTLPAETASSTSDDDGPGLQCEIDDADFEGMSPWLAARLTPERARRICEQITVDDGRGFLRQMVDNLAVALYVLLPLMAFVLKVLYPLSRRYYVEHLLFVVHFHAFLFLALIVQHFWLMLLGTVGAGSAWLAQIVVPVYATWYPYRGMRRVYGQGRTVTLLKYALLLLAYVISFALLLAAAALLAAISL